MRVRFSQSAERDLAAGFEFYEKQIAGLGAYFLESMYADIEALRFHAGIHRKTGRYHRCRAKRFPFAIYYFIDGDVTNVRAVLDARQAPASIQRRLRDPS